MPSIFTTLALIGCSIEKIALEIRHLQRTEVREAEEFFAAGQKGSSSMPHKRNPIASENLTGLARVLRGNALAAMENVPLWHERDISHSSVERIIAPDSTILLDYMLVRMTRVLDRLVVYPENMQRNLELTGGLLFSQQAMLALTKKGLTREEAYRVVQKNAMAVWQEGGQLKERLGQDPEVTAHLSAEELDDRLRPCVTTSNMLTRFLRRFLKGNRTRGFRISDRGRRCFLTTKDTKITKISFRDLRALRGERG